MANAQQSDRARRARTLRIIGVVALVAAVVFLFAAGPLPAAALVVLAAGHFLSTGPVESTGVAPLWARLLILVGGVGFVVAIVVTTIDLASA